KPSKEPPMKRLLLATCSIVLLTAFVGRAQDGASSTDAAPAAGVTISGPARASPGGSAPADPFGTATLFLESTPAPAVDASTGTTASTATLTAPGPAGGNRRFGHTVLVSG